MSVETFEHFFKPEVRNSGRAFVTKGKASLSQLSDTEIQVYIRTSTPFKVTCKTESVASDTIGVDCTCPQSRKGQFCKHIWAALLAIEERKSDFLDSKTGLEKKSASNFKQSSSQEAYKLKQADYRKQRYEKEKQKQKDWQKERKINNQSLKKQSQTKKDTSFRFEFPVPVERALEYFLENGFPLEESLTEDSVGIVKKKLARIFHPDLGGNHNEILELNKHVEILLKYMRSTNL